MFDRRLLAIAAKQYMITLKRRWYGAIIAASCFFLTFTFKGSQITKVQMFIYPMSCFLMVEVVFCFACFILPLQPVYYALPVTEQERKRILWYEYGIGAVLSVCVDTVYIILEFCTKRSYGEGSLAALLFVGMPYILVLASGFLRIYSKKKHSRSALVIQSFAAVFTGIGGIGAIYALFNLDHLYVYIAAAVFCVGCSAIYFAMCVKKFNKSEAKFEHLNNRCNGLLKFSNTL